MTASSSNTMHKDITFVLYIKQSNGYWSVNVSEPNSNIDNCLFISSSKRSAEITFFNVYHNIKDSHFTTYAASFDDFKVVFKCNKDLVGRR